MIDSTAARPEAMRRTNLSLVLREVHRDGALTRAELTQRLGLSRSTIGALVAELVELDVLRESVPNGGSRAGRPSHVVAPHGGGPWVLAVDIDVAQVVVAAVGIGGTVLARHVLGGRYLSTDPESIAALIAESLPRLQAEIGEVTHPRAVGVSVPGTVDRYSGVVGFAPNLEWRDTPFGTRLADLIGADIPVLVGNDADLSVLAEHARGAARGCPDTVFLIGRVGVGAGIMSNGTPLRGHDGHAGEIGHNVVEADGPPCHCGKRGCLETYVGAQALVSFAGSTDLPTPAQVTAVFDAARAGDPRSVEAVDKVAGALGRGIASLVNTLNPQLVLLGGSLSSVLDLARPTLEASMERYTLEPPFESVRLMQPGLGRDSALLGAAEIAFTPLLDDPYIAR